MDEFEEYRYVTLFSYLSDLEIHLLRDMQAVKWCAISEKSEK